MTDKKNARIIRIGGTPNEKQKQFFDSRARFTAYGGARGGGKSWALRRKLVALCLRYAGIKCLLVRRSLPELKTNHLLAFLREYGELFEYKESEKTLYFHNGSVIILGYCAYDKDALRYQGQEFDIIAIDEATQLSEYRFSIFKACLRGTNPFPRRMYLTCNPGGIGHSWVKRLFIDRSFSEDEDPKDYFFVQALVCDNPILTSADSDYVSSLRSLPPRLRDAWLYGDWNVFEGQFFPEFDASLHVCEPSVIPKFTKRFIALDYGLDMLAALLIAVDESGNLFVEREICASGLILSEAAERVAELSRGCSVELAVCSPDLWNRRQDSGRSGFEIMQSVYGMPPMVPADNRRIPGWRVLREYLTPRDDHPYLRISSSCQTLIRSLPALICDASRPEDASDEPHSVTHAPEALRYAVMSRIQAPEEQVRNDFTFPQKHKFSLFD